MRCQSLGVSVANPPDGADAPPPATWTMMSAPPLCGDLLDYLVGPLDGGDVGGDELVRGEVLHGVPADRGDVCRGGFQARGHGGAGSPCAAGDQRALTGEILGLHARCGRHGR